MANLLFDPTELLLESTALQKLADKFIHDESPFRLEELSSDLEGLLQTRGGKLTLTIPEDRPLKTRVSCGEFEPGRKTSSRKVYGEITGVWKIELSEHRVPSPARPNKKVKPRKLIGFTGLASAVFQVRDESTGQVLAYWKMELGDENAPGCFFHTFFATRDQAFPVPRHPNVFVTPMAAIAFALGELFQDDWERVVSGTTHEPNQWRSIQKKRLEALLGWQLDLVSKTTSSPWCTLKLAKPKNTLFL